MAALPLPRKTLISEAFSSHQAHCLPSGHSGGLSTFRWAAWLVAMSSAKGSTFKAWANPVNAT